MDNIVVFQETFLEDLEGIVQKIADENVAAATKLGNLMVNQGESLAFFPDAAWKGEDGQCDALAPERSSGGVSQSGHLGGAVANNVIHGCGNARSCAATSWPSTTRFSIE